VSTIKVIKGDITTLKVDAIVNAANSELRGGGGVDGAIHQAGGPAIMEACRKIGGCPVGQAVITTAGNMPAKFVIHTVGPIWGSEEGNEDALLESAYLESMKLALKNEVNSMSFPNISTGVYGFPKERAAKVAVKTVRNFLQIHKLSVIFVCFDEENFLLYKNLSD
jgi:O-acetyl-ADP-ribose deacetylase